MREVQESCLAILLSLNNFDISKTQMNQTKQKEQAFTLCDCL